MIVGDRVARSIGMACEYTAPATNDGGTTFKGSCTRSPSKDCQGGHSEGRGVSRKHFKWLGAETDMIQYVEALLHVKAPAASWFR